MDELLQRQFVREIGFTSARKGHPAIMLNLNPAAGFIIGCEIGVDFILVVCTNFAPEIIWRHEEHTDPSMGQAAILNRAKALLNEANGHDSYPGLFGLLERIYTSIVFLAKLSKVAHDFGGIQFLWYV